MEWITLLGSYAGAVVTIVGLFTLIIKPLRERFVSWVSKTSDKDNINGKIDNLTTLVEKSINQNEQLQAEMNKQSEALKASLRNSILKIYYDCKAKGYITTFQLQNVTELFENYKSLGGNSFISHIMEEILNKIPVRDN